MQLGPLTGRVSQRLGGRLSESRLDGYRTIVGDLIEEMHCLRVNLGLYCDRLFDVLALVVALVHFHRL